MILNIFKKKQKISSSKRLSMYLESKQNIDEFFTVPKGFKLEISNYKAERLAFDIINSEGLLYNVDIQFEESYGGNKLYIYNIQREVENKSKEYSASKILDGIAELAEKFKFEYVALNPVASKTFVNTLEQEQLEEWYIRHLGRRKFIYKSIPFSDALYTIDR